MTWNGGGAYDASELRGRIAVCFSAAELRRLAEELGASGIDHDRGVGEAARQLVRHFERQGALGGLVERLRAARPLVEWPEPKGAAGEVEGARARGAGPPPEHERTLPSEEHEPLPAPPPDLADDGYADRDEDREATVIRSGVGPPSTPRQVPAAPPAPAEAPILDPYAPQGGGSAAWPGTTPADAPAPARGLDPRILIAVAGLMLLAVAGAYLVGRAGAPPAAGPAPAASGAERPRRAEGVATRAADAVARGLESVARACEIEPGASAGEVMQRAFARCGPEPLAPKLPGRPPPLVPGAPPEPQPPPPSTRPQPPPGAPAVLAGPSNAGCLAACGKQQQACNKSQCGSEPTEGSKYKAYQDCLGKCLVDASRCRLTCE
jgi:hypothetical protein